MTTFPNKLARFRRTADGCWQWLGTRGSKGYGVVCRIPGRWALAYKTIYEALVGPVPPGLELDHLCRNQMCVNPDHLEPVTHRENILRGENPAAWHARQTHCRRGHPLAGDNLKVEAVYGRQRRLCRTCVAASRARSRRARACA